MAVLRNRVENSDITIMNTWYTRQYKDENGKWQDDSITVVYRDNNTLEKHHETIYKPDYTYYQIKDKYVKDHNIMSIEKEKCDEIVVPYRNLDKSIAERTNNLEAYKRNVQCRMRNENKKFGLDPSIMASDTDINDHYRFLFNRDYTNRTDIPLYKGYFDIEVDGKYAVGDFPEMGECPINCCSYLDDKTSTVYTFILRNYNNPLMVEYEKSVNDELYEELKEFVIKNVGGYKRAKKLGLIDFKYKHLFYDNEEELIYSMFQLFHTIDPDFILAWNMSFDIPYVIARCEELGLDPNYYMTSSAYHAERPFVQYYVDERHKNDLAERCDFCKISGDIVWLDQMIQFASIRKSGKESEFPDFKLDTIGEIVAGVNKLDYSHITTHIEELPYLDFKTFVFYNVMDVVVQKAIEMSTRDINMIFQKAISNNTQYSKVHRQTTYLINRFKKSFDEDGLVIGTNTNRWNEKPKEKYAGALVGRPENVSSYSKLVINGRPICVIDNLYDEDYKSLYPSVTLENNITAPTLIAMIEMPEKVYEHENFFSNEKYSRSGEFIENLVCDNTLEFHSRYFNLANIEQLLLEDLPEYMGQAGTGDQLLRENTMFNPFITTEATSMSPFEEWDSNPFLNIVDSREDYQEHINRILEGVI